LIEENSGFKRRKKIKQTENVWKRKEKLFQVRECPDVCRMSFEICNKIRSKIN